MSTVTASRLGLRATLRHPDDALPRSLIGTVPMLMVEQDATWGPPSESAAIGRRVLATALRRHARADSTGSAGAPG